MESGLNSQTIRTLWRRAHSLTSEEITSQKNQHFYELVGQHNVYVFHVPFNQVQSDQFILVSPIIAISGPVGHAASAIHTSSSRGFYRHLLEKRRPSTHAARWAFVALTGRRRKPGGYDLP